jgi:hypothetical protein
MFLTTNRQSRSPILVLPLRLILLIAIVLVSYGHKQHTDYHNPHRHKHQRHGRIRTTNHRNGNRISSRKTIKRRHRQLPSRDEYEISHSLDRTFDKQTTTTFDYNKKSILDGSSINTNVLRPSTTTTATATTSYACPATTVAHTPAVYIENLYLRYEIGTINFTDPTTVAALEDAFIHAYNHLVVCASTSEREVADGAILEVEAAYLMFGHDHTLRTVDENATHNMTSSMSSSSFFQNDFFLMSIDLRCNYCQSFAPDSTTLEECDIVVFDSSSGSSRIPNNREGGVGGVLDCACVPPTKGAFAEKLSSYLPSELMSDVVITAVSDIVVVPTPTTTVEATTTNTTTPSSSSSLSTTTSNQAVLVRNAAFVGDSTTTTTADAIIDFGMNFPSLLVKQRGCIPLGAEGLVEYANNNDSSNPNGDGGGTVSETTATRTRTTPGQSP